MNSIVVARPADWKLLADNGLSMVVDPMVFRSADIFLRGRANVERPEEAWTALSRNIGSLCSFFDVLVLDRCLPIFDYDMSFPPDQHTGRYTLIEWCNERGPTLQPVKVTGEAYAEIKREALAALNAQPDVAPDLKTDILQETSAFDWEWRPDLWNGEWKEIPATDEVLSAFRYGGLLFGGYAQRIGGTHLLQPKRARLFLADRLRAERAEDERMLFARLTQFAGDHGSSAADWPASPTFLPFLLAQDPRHPRDLLYAALRLRGDCDVGAYREWRCKALSELSTKGRIGADVKRDLEEVWADVARSLTPAKSKPAKVSAKIGAKIATLGPEVSFEAGLEREFDISLGWMPGLQGRPHIKMLQRMVSSRLAYERIERHLKLLWDAAPKSVQ